MNSGTGSSSVRRGEISPMGAAPHSSPSSGLGFLASTCMTLNFILGAGFLSIPWAYNSAGIALGIVTTAIVSLVCNVSKNVIIEALSRAQAIRRLLRRSSSTRAGNRVGGGTQPDPEPQVETKRAATRLQSPDSLHSLNPLSSYGSISSTSEDSRQDFRHGSGSDSDNNGVMRRRSSTRSLLANPQDEESPLSIAVEADEVQYGEDESGEEGTARQRLLSRSYPTPLYEFGNDKLEMPEVIKLFCGNAMGNFYTAVFAMYQYGANWGYVSVFASSISVLVSWEGERCEADELSLGRRCFPVYASSVALFALFAVPMSCLEITEQVTVQLVMSLIRVVCMSLMLLTVVMAWLSPDQGAEAFQGAPRAVKVMSGNSTSPSTASGSGLGELSAWINFQGLPRLLSIAVFAQIVHHSIPGILHSIRDKPRNGRRVFGAAFSVTTFFYCSLGAILVAFFRTHNIAVAQSVNQVWSTWEKSLPPSNLGAYVAAAIRYILVIFPGIDVLSAFPLCAITLGQNLMSLRYASGEVQGQGRFTTILFRLLAACPPILGALLVSDIGAVNQWVGVFGFALVFLFPGLLGRAARKLTVEKFGRRKGERTPYSVGVSPMVYSVLIVLGIIFPVFFFSSLGACHAGITSMCFVA